MCGCANVGLGGFPDLAALATVAIDIKATDWFWQQVSRVESVSVLTLSKDFLPTPIFVLRLIGWICLATIAILSLVPGNIRPHVVETGQVEHLVAYAGTAFFLAAGYSANKQLVGILILLPVYAACMETLQIFVPGRTGQLIGAVVGALGSWSGIGLVLLLRSWTPRMLDRATNI